MKISLTKAFLFTPLIAAVFTLSAFAQGELCALKLEVRDLRSDAVISGAAGTAVNVDTKKAYKAVLKEGMLYFADFTQLSTYKITITKVGYKRTIEERTMTCLPEDNGVVETTIEMQKGSSKSVYTPILMAPEGAIRIEGADEGSAVPAVSAGKTAAGTEAGAVPKIISKGVLNGSAVYLAKPEYPPAAKAVGASGAVAVQVIIDEEGNVTFAAATSGHPLLKAVSADAARASKFKPTRLEGIPVKVSGIIIYNFQ